MLTLSAVVNNVTITVTSDRGLHGVDPIEVVVSELCKAAAAVRQLNTAKMPAKPGTEIIRDVFNGIGGDHTTS